MALNQGKLASIDRRVFAELDRTAGTQAVKVPLSDAVWSTWRRYCEAIGLSMGNGVAGLITHELETVVHNGRVADPVFGERAEREARERADALEERERKVAAQAESLRAREQQFRAWEKRIRVRDRHREPPRGVMKVGRNERCPCGSGVKYKHCHGS